MTVAIGMTHLAAVETGLDILALRVLLSSRGEVNIVHAGPLALVEDMVYVVGSDSAIHTVDVLAGVVAQPDSRVIGARDARAFAGLSADGDTAAEVVLALDEVLSLLGSVNHVVSIALYCALCLWR